MEPTPKPVNRFGNRNINCPFYGLCLDQAVKRNWQSWDCFECKHKADHQPASLVNTDYDFDQYHVLPQHVAREIM